jgi:hypothetical protein
MRRKHKYGAIRTVCSQGHGHPSKKEAKRCCELHLLQKAGKISNLTIQPELMLLPPLTEGYRREGYIHRGIKYIGDFKYYDKEKKTWILEDVKGFKTPVYRLKKKMVQSYLKGMKWKLLET